MEDCSLLKEDSDGYRPQSVMAIPTGINSHPA